MSNRLPETTVKLALAGQLLVSTNRCEDSMLEGCVCLMLHHSPEGSMGVILNRPLDVPLDALLQFLKAPAQKSHTLVRMGGPVSGPVLALHNQASYAEVAPASGIYVAAHLDKLQQLFAASQGEVRLVVGQVVWQSGQLEQQFEHGAWLPLPATPGLVFAPEEEMWARCMREVGNRYVSMLAGTSAETVAILN